MFYEYNPDPIRLYQGDIIKNFPVTELPENIKLVRLKEKGENYSEAFVYDKDQIDNAFENGSEVILANATLMNVMILSQTCDIEHREFVSIAPVFNIYNIEKSAKREAVRKGKTFYRFFLPSSENFQESFLDITTINSVKRVTLKIENRILSLSHYGRHHLVYFINSYFNRPFTLP
jgi:hypothetical protein